MMSLVSHRPCFMKTFSKDVYLRPCPPAKDLSKGPFYKGLNGSPPGVLQVASWAPSRAQQRIWRLQFFLFNECLAPSNLESDCLPCAPLFFLSPLGRPGKRLPTVSLPSPNKPGALVPLQCESSCSVTLPVRTMNSSLRWPGGSPAAQSQISGVSTGKD